MGDIKRRVMRFLIPLSIGALGNSGSAGRTAVPVYINPQTFTISEAKIISKQLTKGGYVIQYWGEELPRIQASGTTGSAGIEGINILRDVYRQEQIQFRRILLDRAKEFAAEAEEALGNTPEVGAGISLVLDTITSGGFSGITDGVSSTLQAIQDAFEGSGNRSRQIELIPTLASFAVSVDLYFQGEKFRGYFTDFQVTESAQSPGLFDYTFNFEVLKRRGKRGNFMPWHRNPVGPAGNIRPASIPIQGQRLNELSFPSDAATTQEQILGGKTTTATVVEDQSAIADINNVGVNKFSKLG
jgi:hypothetical protein